MRDYATIRSHLLWDLEPYLPGNPYCVSDDTVRGAMARALADSFYKKLCPLGNTTEADSKALIKFKSINDRISNEPFGFSADNEAESCFFDYFIDNLNRCLGWNVGLKNFDLDYIREKMRVGPGAAQKADATSMVTKLFEGDMSYCTDEAVVSLYRSALADTGLWADAEMRRSQRFRFVRVEGGKLFFAPKNAEISRTCCTEANVNMLVQQALGAFIEERLALSFGISLDLQPDNNRELARIGSIDGSFGTIDKVSASDSISWQLMLRVLEDGFTKAVLRMSRSESAVLPDGSKVVLKMISTMGNGFTFPLQTVIFASAVRACYQLMGFPCSCPRTQFGVFGDDVIVRREVYDFYCRMISKLGFEVNGDKSFNNGPFRESCGHDYFRGVNIRGVYVRSLETPQEVCSCINRLIRWSARSGIPLYRTIGYLRGLVAKAPRVPRSEADDVGIKVPFLLSRPSVDDNYWFRYRYWERQTRKRRMPEADDHPNPEGLGVGFLSGHIRRREFSIQPSTKREASDAEHPGVLLDWPAVISIRERKGGKSRYKIRSRSLPWWDWPGPVVKQGWRQLIEEDYNDGVVGNHVSQSAWEGAMMAHFNI